MSARNIHQRLAAVMGKVSYVQKEKKSGMKYSIVSHDAVTALCRPALLEEGIVYYPVKTVPSQTGNRAECHMTMRFVNIDDPIDLIDVEVFGHGIDDQDKGPGKAMSYATKYALLKTLGLETGDDPEFDQAAQHKPEAHGVPEASIDAYVAQTEKQIAAIEDRDTLVRWWKDQDFPMGKLGIKSGDEAWEKVRAAWMRRGKAIATAKEPVAA